MGPLSKGWQDAPPRPLSSQTKSTWLRHIPTGYLPRGTILDKHLDESGAFMDTLIFNIRCSQISRSMHIQ